MVAAIVTIGTELTRGEVSDTNAPWLAARLTSLGFEVHEIVCVDDDIPRVREVLQRLGRTMPVVVVTGGLGPTTDDVTVVAAAEAAGVPVARDIAVLAHVQRRYGPRTPGAMQEKLADIPRGAEVLGHTEGSGPAFRLAVGGADCYFLPGAPEEMARVFDDVLARRLIPLAVPRSYQVVLRTYGLSEGSLGERLSDIEATVPGVTVRYQNSPPEVDVKVLARGDDAISARSRAAQAAAGVRARLGDVVFGEGDEPYAAVVGRGLRARGFTLAVAESCTGGLVGTMLTAVPGSSDYLLLDAVTYSNAAKESVLDVPSEVLRAHGAVSSECVRAMAEGVRRLTGADLAVSISGVAGPGGGTADKPVGRVYLALSRAHGTEVIERNYPGDRATVQRSAAYEALSLIRGACRGPVTVPPPAPGCE